MPDSFHFDEAHREFIGAIQRQKVELVQQLLPKVDVNFHDPESFWDPPDDDCEYTPLHYAACTGYVRMVALLLQAGAYLEARTSRGATPLHAALDRGRWPAATYLLEAGADPKAFDVLARSPLHLAAVRDQVDLVRRLLDLGVEVDLKTADGETPLEVAVGRHALAVAELLLEAGADANRAILSPEAGDSLALLTSLVRHGANVNRCDSDGLTALHHVCLEPHRPADCACAKFLLSEGADPSAADQDKDTPLHVAACRGDIELVKLLLQYGAQLYITNAAGHTPLHLAVLARKDAAARMLREADVAHVLEVPDIDDFAEAKRAALRAMTAGYPAILHGHNWGPCSWAGPELSGLMVYPEGDTIPDDASPRWQNGHSEGIREFLREGGKPWNDRSAWLAEIHDPETWFARVQQSSASVRMTCDGPEITSEDGQIRLRLTVQTGGGCQDLWLELRSTRLWGVDPACILTRYVNSIYPHFLRDLPDIPAGWEGPLPPPRPSGRWESRELCLPVSGRPLPPPGVEPPWCTVEFVWGPPGSPLVFFRLEEPERKVLFVVLDCELGIWLPPKDPRGNRRRRG